MTDQAENAALLVAGVAIEIGKLAVEMADVAGDVQRVSRLVDGQAELFGDHLPEQRRIVSELDALQAEGDVLERVQAETAAELDALMPSILSKAFNGEL